MAEELEIGSGVKGKQAELIVFGKLLERGYKVYTPMVDIGIDCLVDVGGGNYKEIQIKSREDSPVFTARKFKPRDNFYFVCFRVNGPRGANYDNSCPQCITHSSELRGRCVYNEEKTQNQTRENT